MKIIPVNGKPEKAYAIVRTEKTQLVDFSGERAFLIDDVSAGTATEGDKTRLHELAAYLSPELALVADKVAAGNATEEDKARLNLITENTTRERVIYRILFWNWAYEFHLSLPEMTVLTLDNIARLDYEQEQTDLDVNLLWSSITFLLPGTIKEREVYVVLPNKSKVKVKVPKGKRLMAASSWGGSLPKGLTIDEQEFVDRLEATRKADAAQGEKTADTEAHAKKAANKAVNKEIAPIVETLKKALLIVTPARDRQWWQNLRAAYDRESAPTQSAKWHAVAHMVVLCVKTESQKAKQDRQCDYLTPRMLGTLIKKLTVPDADSVKIENTLADTLRRKVARAEQKAAKLAKARA